MYTSTEAGLVISAGAYDEILEKLAAANYHHLLGPRNEFISMSGIRLLCGPERPHVPPGHVGRTDENERREIYGTSQKRIVTLEDRALQGGVSIIVVDEVNTTQSAVALPWEAIESVVRDLGVRGAMVHLKRTAPAG